MLSSARSRAKALRLPFDLTEQWALETWTGRCAVTDLPFALGIGTWKEKMRSPSIDRIDNDGGYTQGNCRFILWAVNAIKGTGSDADVLEIAKAIVANSLLQL